MEKVLIKILFIMAGLLVFHYADAQDDKRLFYEALRQLQAKYQDSSAISCDVKYLYTNETAASKVLDSLSGTISIKGKKFCLSLNGNETVRTEEYLIHVSKDDRLIYLARSQSQHSGMGGNPAEMVDSILTRMNVQSYSVRKDNYNKILEVVFVPGSAVKSMQVQINVKTGLIDRTAIVLKTSEFLQKNSYASDTYNFLDEYTVITTLYMNFKENIDDSAFNPQHYFIKNGKEYKAAGRYSDYKIFLGTPNL